MALPATVAAATAANDAPSGATSDGPSFVESARNGLTGVGIVLKDNPNVASWRVDERTDISRFLNRLLGDVYVKALDMTVDVVCVCSCVRVPVWPRPLRILNEFDRQSGADPRPFFLDLFLCLVIPFIQNPPSAPRTGLEVDIQNALFDYFSKTLQAVILASKQSGSFDMGIMDLGLGPGESVRKLKDRSRSFHIISPTGAYSVDLNCFGVERGTTWARAVETWRETDQADDGFYVSRTPSLAGRLAVVLAVAVQSKKAEAAGEKTFQLYKASTGLQSKLEIVSELKRKYKKGDDERGIGRAERVSMLRRKISGRRRADPLPIRIFST